MSQTLSNLSVDELVRVGQAAYGKGVFARRRLTKGTILGEVTGEVIIDEDYSSNYCIDLGGPRRLEPAAPFRFINHACDPNCRFLWYQPNPARNQPHGTIWVEVLKLIEPGEQLSVDYSWPADSAIPCGCRTPKCRGWIVNPAELSSLLTTLALPK